MTRPVPTLQIRDLPERVYRALRERARRERRSLSRQAIVELERLLGEEQRCRREKAVQEVRRRLASRGEVRVAREPERVVREDRER